MTRYMLRHKVVYPDQEWPTNIGVMATPTIHKEQDIGPTGIVLNVWYLEEMLDAPTQEA